MDNLLPTKFATEYCGVSKVAIKKAVDSGRLKPAYIDISKNGNKNLGFYFYREDLDKYNDLRRSKTDSEKYNTERNVSIMNNEENIVNEVVTNTYTTYQNDKFSDDNDCDTTVDDSCISTLNINPELENLLPPLSEEKLSQLEAEILHDKRVIDPIITWKGIIVDGHNRYKIAKKHNISFNITEKSFKDTEEAKLWIIKHQMNRRNVSTYESCCLVLKFKDKIATEAQARMKAGKADPTQKFAEGETMEILAKMVNTSRETLRKVEKLENRATPELKEQLRNGEISISAAYDQLFPPKKTKSAKVTKQSADESTAQAKKFEPSTTIDESSTDTDKVIDTPSEESSAINNSDTSPAEEELQQYENTDQNLAEESLIAADIKESFTDNEVTTTESTEQGIISHIKDCNNYINLLLLTSPYYSTEEALQKEWKDSIILLPPVDLIDSFIEKLHNSNVSEALLIVPDDHCDKINDDIKGMSILWGLYLPFANEWYNIFYFAPKENGDEINTSSD